MEKGALEIETWAVASMNADLHQRHLHGETEQSASRILLVVILLVLVLASGWLAGRNLFFPQDHEPTDRYLGLVQLAPDEQGHCEQFELDNRSGVLRPKGASRCLDITASAPGGGPVGRLHGIREYFRSK